MQARVEVFQIAIVGKHPIAPPQLPHKRVAVGQRDGTHRGFAYMGHHVMALDRVAAQHLCNGRGGGALAIDKTAHTLTGRTAVGAKEGYAPAIRMVVSATAALRKARETQCEARRQVAVHSKQLAHGKQFTR